MIHHNTWRKEPVTPTNEQPLKHLPCFSLHHEHTLAARFCRVSVCRPLEEDGLPGEVSGRERSFERAKAVADNLPSVYLSLQRRARLVTPGPGSRRGSCMWRGERPNRTKAWSLRALFRHGQAPFIGMVLARAARGWVKMKDQN